MSLKAYQIDEQGFYTEDYIYEEGIELESNIVLVEMPEGLYKPKWDGEKWIEGATKEYIDKVNYIPTPQPTQADRIKDLEMALAEMFGGAN